MGLMLATVDAKDDKGKDKGNQGGGHSEKGGNGNKEEKREDKADKKDAKDEAKSDKRDDKAEKRDDKDFDTRKIVRFEDNDRKLILGYFDGHTVATAVCHQAWSAAASRSRRDGRTVWCPATA